MKRIAVLLLLTVALPAFAQPTLTYDQFLSVFLTSGVQGGTEYTSSDATSLQALVNITGANQTWDFSHIAFTQNGTAPTSNPVVPYPGGAAMADQFPTATHVEASVSGNITTYNFYQINDTAFLLLGESVDTAGKGSSVILSATPGIEYIKFPCTYGTTWSSSSAVHSSSIPAGTAATWNLTGSADGWGTFILPTGSYSNALRTKMTNSITVSGFTVQSNTTYSLHSSTGYQATIETSSSGTTGTYQVPFGSGTKGAVLPNVGTGSLSLEIGSNPLSMPSSVMFTMPQSGNVRVGVMDALGRESKVLLNGFANQGMNSISFDPTGLANGTYFVRLSGDAGTAMTKVVIQH